MNSNPYFRWAASWIGFAVGVIAWGILITFIPIQELEAFGKFVASAAALIGMPTLGAFLLSEYGGV